MAVVTGTQDVEVKYVWLQIVVMRQPWSGWRYALFAESTLNLAQARHHHRLDLAPGHGDGNKRDCLFGHLFNPWRVNHGGNHRYYFMALAGQRDF
jgi:hypothetical protein